MREGDDQWQQDWDDRWKDDERWGEGRKLHKDHKDHKDHKSHDKKKDWSDDEVKESWKEKKDKWVDKIKSDDKDWKDWVEKWGDDKDWKDWGKKWGDDQDWKNWGDDKENDWAPMEIDQKTHTLLVRSQFTSLLLWLTVGVAAFLGRSVASGKNDHLQSRGLFKKAIALIVLASLLSIAKMHFDRKLFKSFKNMHDNG